MSRTSKRIGRFLRDSILKPVNYTVYELGLQNGIVNNREIRFIGLQRSGNHALLNWIFAQSPEKKCLLNWVQPAQNPFYSFHRKSTLRELQPDFHKKFNLNLEKCGIFSKKETLIYSYEDDSLDKIACEEFEKNHDRWIGRSRHRYDILLIRDPFNLIASRLKRDDGDIKNRYSFRIPEERKIIISLWKQYAKEYLGLTNFLLHDKVCINFNRWFLDASYRREIANRLNLKFDDSGMATVSTVGGGSSFDSTGYDSKASEMKVLDRWKHYKDDKDFKTLFNDSELMDLSRAIFGDVIEIQ